MGVQYICLVACKIQPVDGYVSVCQVLTPDTSNLVIRIQGICNICINIYKPITTGKSTSRSFRPNVKKLFCLYNRFYHFNNTTAYHFGWYWYSCMCTKELHLCASYIPGTNIIKSFCNNWWRNNEKLDFNVLFVGTWLVWTTYSGGMNYFIVFFQPIHSLFHLSKGFLESNL